MNPEGLREIKLWRSREMGWREVQDGMREGIAREGYETVTAYLPSDPSLVVVGLTREEASSLEGPDFDARDLLTARQKLNVALRSDQGADSDE